MGLLKVLRRLRRDRRGAGWLETLLVTVVLTLGGAAVLYGILAGGRQVGGDIAADFRNLKTSGTIVDQNSGSLTVTTTTGSSTGAATGVTGN